LINSPKLRARAVVAGMVQGVGFRFWTERKAEALGLSGWVRNLYDGRVEVVLEGSDTLVREMVESLQGGPPGAQVEKVEVSWSEKLEDLRGFVIKGSI
jgi:acylphosphatase